MITRVILYTFILYSRGLNIFMSCLRLLILTFSFILDVMKLFTDHILQLLFCESCSILFNPRFTPSKLIQNICLFPLNRINLN